MVLAHGRCRLRPGAGWSDFRCCDPLGADVDPGASLLVLAGCILAGTVGALVGIGGGIFVIPLLTVGFGIDLRLAIGASVVSVIATSSGAAAAYVRDGLTNVRIGIFLELATTAGAVTGAMVATSVAPRALYLLLGIVMLVSAILQLPRIRTDGAPQRWQPAGRLRLAGRYHDAGRGTDVSYVARRVPAGFALMAVAGAVSGLLGIGSGALKVLALDLAMGLPMKVSSATSNFMIGVTAAASAGIYLGRGDIDPTIAAPVALGVAAGALLGARLLPRLSNTAVRRLFLPILVVVAGEMLLRGIGGEPG